MKIGQLVTRLCCEKNREKAIKAQKHYSCYSKRPRMTKSRAPAVPLLQHLTNLTDNAAGTVFAGSRVSINLTISNYSAKHIEEIHKACLDMPVMDQAESSRSSLRRCDYILYLLVSRRLICCSTPKFLLQVVFATRVT